MTLEEAILSLGLTSNQVAATIRAEGIKGRRRDSSCCPVALYLSKKTHNDILVGNFFCCRSAYPTDRIRLTESVRYFVSNFDTGLLKDLEA